MKKVLVTGCNGGIGSAIFWKLRVMSKGGLIPIVEETDIDTNPSIYQLGEKTYPLADFDAIICAHGINLRSAKPYKDLWPEMQANYHLVMDIAQNWIFQRNLLGKMRRNVFIAIVSNSANIARSFSEGYCASKAALDMGLKCLQRSSGPWYEFYSLCPGTVNTSMTHKMIEAARTDEEKAAIASPKPLGRLIEPGEIAEIVWFILSNPAAVLMSGTTLRLDGGER